MADVDFLDGDIEREKCVSTFQSEHRIAGRPPRESFTGSDAVREKRAFHDWMLTGAVDRSILCESRTVGDVAGVGMVASKITNSILVPTGFDPDLYTAQKSYGELVGAVRTLNTATGESQKVSLLDADAERAVARKAHVSLIRVRRRQC